jgi:hypothetical protein
LVSNPLRNAIGGQLGVVNTPPTLPEKTIVSQSGVKIEHYYRSNDHSPAHAHVIGGGQEVKIGKSGQPLPGEPKLSPKQAKVIQQNKSIIHTKINRIRKYIKYFK